jgi:hypothetical protein
MANYSLIANSTFQPFSYQELMAPVARMSDVHSAIAEQYDKLSSQADVLEAMGANDRDKDSGTYERYKNYSNALRAEAENLYRNGLDINSRMRLSDLRRRYNQEIVPIQNAWNTRKQEAEVQMKAKLQNPSLEFTRDASESDLDYYINNPTGGYGVVNMSAITADMAAAAKNLAGQIKKGAKVEGVDQLTYSYIQEHGLDDVMISEWIRNPEANPALTNMMNQVLAKYGVTEQDLAGTQNGARILTKGRQAAQLGAWNSIGETKSQLHTNEAAKMALQHYYNEVEADNAARRTAAAKEQEAGLTGSDDLFSFQPGQLPIASKDKNIDDSVSKNAAALGLSYDKKTPGKYTASGITIVPSSIQGEGTRYTPKFTVSLYDSNGNVKRWETFKKDVERNIPKTQNGQTLNAIDRQRIIVQAHKQFNNAVSTARTLGLNPSRGYTQKDVERALTTQRNSGAAGYINGYNWNHKNGDWNPTAQKMLVREITKVDNNGKFTFGKNYTLADVLDTSDKAPINSKGGDVHAFISNQNGQQGIIFTAKGRQFFVSKDALAASNTYGKKAFELLDLADISKGQADIMSIVDPMEAYTQSEIAKNNTSAAISLLETAFVSDNADTTNKAIDNSEAAKK